MTLVEQLRTQLDELPDDATVIVEIHHVHASPTLREVTSCYAEQETTFPVLRLISQH